LSNLVEALLEKTTSGSESSGFRDSHCELDGIVEVSAFSWRIYIASLDDFAEPLLQ
jgi:hypothetical protein